MIEIIVDSSYHHITQDSIKFVKSLTKFQRWGRYLTNDARGLTKEEVAIAEENNIELLYIDVADYTGSYQKGVEAAGKAIAMKSKLAPNHVTYKLFLDVEMKPDLSEDFAQGWYDTTSKAEGVISGFYMPNKRCWPKQWEKLPDWLGSPVLIWTAEYPYQSQSSIEQGTSSFRHATVEGLIEHGYADAWQYLGNVYGKKYDFSVSAEGALDRLGKSCYGFAL